MDSAGASILQETRSYVQGIFSTKLNPSFLFHNLQHTEGVVKASEEMADYYQLTDDDRLILLLAAWFHDTGYSYGQAEKHEEAGMDIARNFLRRYPSMTPVLTDRVIAAIGATRMPQSPTNLLEEILCDADLFHLGTADFKERSKLLRKEINLLGILHYNKEEWNAKNVEFLKKHHYFTSYCREKLDPVVQRNIKELEEKYPPAEAKQHGHNEEKERNHSRDHAYEKTQAYSEPGKDFPETSEPQQPLVIQQLTGIQQPHLSQQPVALPENIEDDSKMPAGKNKKGNGGKSDKADKAEKADKADKAEKSERGITTTFRITSSNHSNLSHMADNKAHILISVNSIIISIIISLLIRHLQDHHNLIIPTTIVMVVSVVTMVFAILATRPNVSHGVFNSEDVKNRKVNLLFFGNFFNMSVDEYEAAMKVMIEDRTYMYDSIIKDIYYQGIVLARKYKYLRIAYNVFMYGIIVSVLAFSITMFFM